MCTQPPETLFSLQLEVYFAKPNSHQNLCLEATLDGQADANFISSGMADVLGPAMRPYHGLPCQTSQDVVELVGEASIFLEWQKKQRKRRVLVLENLGGLSHGIVLSRRRFENSQAKIPLQRSRATFK